MDLPAWKGNARLLCSSVALFCAEAATRPSWTCSCTAMPRMTRRKRACAIAIAGDDRSHSRRCRARGAASASMRRLDVVARSNVLCAARSTRAQLSAISHPSSRRGTCGTQTQVRMVSSAKPRASLQSAHIMDVAETLAPASEPVRQGRAHMQRRRRRHVEWDVHCCGSRLSYSAIISRRALAVSASFAHMQNRFRLRIPSGKANCV